MTNYVLNPTPLGRSAQTTPVFVNASQSHRTTLSIKDTVQTTGTSALHLSLHFYTPPARSIAVSTGRVRLIQSQGNLFKDFSFYDTAGADPALVLVTSSVSGTAYDPSSASNYRRLSLTASLPEDYPVSSGLYAWNRAAFVGVGARVNGMAQGNYAYVDGAQVEFAPAGSTTPTPYTPARSLQCSVRPNRLNHIRNGTFRNNVTDGWPGSSGVTLDTTVGYGGTPNSALITGTGTSFLATGYQTSGIPVRVQPGQVWSLSCVAKRKVRSPNIRLMLQDQTGAIIAASPVILNDSGAFVPAGMTVTVPTGVNLMQAYIIIDAQQAGDAVNVDAVLLEQSPVVGTYFDGNSGVDYLWEQGTSAYNGRSYYYRDYTTRSYLLRSILAQNVPLGVTPAVPQFAVSPVASSTVIPVIPAGIPFYL